MTGDIATHSSNFSSIRFSVAESIATITVNRPSVMNALDARTVGELGGAFGLALADDAVRGVVLTGSGDRAFVAGADIGEIHRASPLEAEANASAGQQLTCLIESFPKPVIAAVNGLALGGGCELAMACSIRLAAPHAQFGQPEVKLGLIPGFGGSQRLPRLVGKGRALQIILTGEMVSADEAYRIGLVNEVVEASSLLARAHAILKSIQLNGPVATRFAMEAVNRGSDAAIADGLALERSLFGLCAATEDKNEGASAFLEKRQPKFSGR